MTEQTTGGRIRPTFPSTRALEAIYSARDNAFDTEPRTLIQQAGLTILALLVYWRESERER